MIMLTTRPARTGRAAGLAAALASVLDRLGDEAAIGDGSAGLVAEDFYRRLTSGGTKPPDTSMSCYALHAATRRLRDRFPDQPRHWAGYIHTGG